MLDLRPPACWHCVGSFLLCFRVIVWTEIFLNLRRYSHGFLFPSEASRVRRSILSHLSPSASLGEPEIPSALAAGKEPSDLRSPASWAYSSVSTFRVRYSPPIQDLTTVQGIEAMVEGSAMSRLKEGGDISASDAWAHREGRRTRYEDRRVGGTVVVHFIKKNPWFLETGLALLEGDEVTSTERRSHAGHLTNSAYADAYDGAGEKEQQHR